MCLDPATRHELKNLVDELIAATDNHTYWLGPVRDTSLELRALLSERVTNEAPPLVEPATANWKCPAPGCRFSSITPMSHPCPL